MVSTWTFISREHALTERLNGATSNESNQKIKRDVIASASRSLDVLLLFVTFPKIRRNSTVETVTVAIPAIKVLRAVTLILNSFDGITAVHDGNPSYWQVCHSYYRYCKAKCPRKALSFSESFVISMAFLARVTKMFVF